MTMNRFEIIIVLSDAAKTFVADMKLDWPPSTKP